VARSKGLEPFGIFEIMPLGLVQTAIGLTYIALIGRKLLPSRRSMSMMLGGDRRRPKYFTEVAVPEGSSLIGQQAVSVDIFRREGVRLIDVLRGDASLRRDLQAVTLQAGDRVVLRSEMAELLGLQQSRDVRMVGRRLGALRLRRRYGVYPLAVHRRNENIGRQLDDLVVQVGDTLLLEGAADDIERLAADMDLGDVSKPTERAYRRSKAPIAVGALVGVVAFAALGVAPILVCAVIAVAIVLLTRCIDADEAFSFIDGRLLALIFSMLVVGLALDQSGAARLIVAQVEPLLMTLPPVLVIFCVYALASTLTELVSNNAVGVIFTPIAIELGVALGMDPRALVVAVMFAASAAFSTPIGYQTNMLVYGPGGYRFTDYLRVGIPLNITLGIVASLLIPLIWPV
jgi:di/tricarboxylate transporter